MKTNDTQERLKDLKNQLKVNSKDAHFAEDLFEDIVLTSRKDARKDIALDCGKVLDEWTSETFRISKTDRGVMYHAYGGYTLFTTPNETTLYSLLFDLVENKDTYATLQGKEKESFDLNLSAIAYVLSLPRYAFQDSDFTFKCASLAVEYLQSLQEKYLDNAELMDETPEENQEFKDAVLAMEQLKEMDKVTE